MIHYWNSSLEYFEDMYFSPSQYQSILNIEYGLYIIFPLLLEILSVDLGKKKIQSKNDLPIKLLIHK